MKFSRFLPSVAGACLLACLPLFADEVAAPSPESVEAWADEVFGTAMEQHRHSGAVVSMVQDGRMVLSKGYGFADYEAQQAVDPAETRFRIGSISKTFTAVAIAQLMDQGLIDSLDDPANKYLKRIQLPSPGGQEITLAHLFTHSAGFENPVFNLGSDRAHDLPLAAEEIERFQPESISQPGQYSAYNNFGISVLGVIVEDVSGIPVADYFEEHIFEPLGMEKSILNMSPDPSEGLSVPQAFFPSGESMAIPHRTIHPLVAPAGGINATGEDMAGYMLALLDAGAGTDSILSTSGFERMYTQIRSNHERSSGFGMVWFIIDWNGTKLIMHGGNWPGTQSILVLIPEANTGIFYSMLGEFPEVPMLESIIGSERTKPDPGFNYVPPMTNVGTLTNLLETQLGLLQEPLVESTGAAPLSDYVGTYIGRSAPFTTMERLLSLTSSSLVLNVVISEDGEGLMIAGRGPYKPIGDDSFWNDSYQGAPLNGLFIDAPLFNFGRNQAGEVEYLTPQIGFDAWVKSGPMQNPQFLGLAWGMLLLFLLTALVSIFYPRIDGRPLAKWLPAMALALLLAQIATLLFGYAPGETLLDEVIFGHKGRFALFTAWSILFAIIALALGWHVWLAWRESFWHVRRLGALMRVHYSLLGLAAVLLVPVFAALRLFGL